MTAESEDAHHQAVQRRRWFSGASRWALAIAVLVLVGLVIVWSQRRQIADRYVQQALAARGVPARYRIADLGFNRQRLTNLVIGDPRHPDLVADWVEVATSLGFSGVGVTGIRAGQVRVRGVLANGHLSMGAIDRLLPPSGGKPFSLPAIDLDIADGRMRLESPNGLIGIKLRGSGRLDNGFAGTAALISPRLALTGCTADRAAATLAIKIVNRQPRLAGPVRSAAIACGPARADRAGATIDVMLDERLDRWRGNAMLSAAAIDHPYVTLRATTGKVDFDGSWRQTTGALDLRTSAIRWAAGAAQQGRLAGKYRVGSAGLAFAGALAAERAAVAPRWLAILGRYGNVADGTPIAALWQRIVGSAQAAGRRFTLSADVAISQGAGGTALAISSAQVQSASGARISLNRGTGIGIDQRGIRLNGVLALVGGGLPEAIVDLRQAAPGSPVTGIALVRPYAAGGDRLALTAVDFTASPDGATRISTRATVSGPMGNGRIESASLPIDAYWNGQGRLRVNPGCAPLSFDRLAISGLVLEKTQLALCAIGPALVSIDHGALAGGGKVIAPRLIGTLGRSPVSLAAGDAHFALASRAFGVSAVKVRLGAPDRVSTLDVDRLVGRITGTGVEGVFEGGAGQVARVPLLLSGSAGDWRLSGGKLGIAGQLTVADADAAPRFSPLISKDVSLTLADDAINATGTLLEPGNGVRVANVTLAHDLSSGIGHADLDVPGLVFGPDFQPDKLTRFTYGVIADVVGTVAGAGHIRWTPEGTTSDGAFNTRDTNLAAAFGPVTGLSGEIRFTDLLNLETAPGQVATIALVNPGIPVLDGTLRYRLLPGSKVAVEGARWPFAGGELILEPSVLDLGATRERRLTFRVVGVDAGQFLQQFDFKDLNATGTFDGLLPMVFDEAGGRIQDGHLTVRESGGTIAYVGELSQKDLGFWANMAFQALKSLRYKSVDIVMNGALAGEMITEVRFAGVSQGAGAKSNFLVRRLQQLPLVFNVRIAAPFRQLLDSVQSYYDPRRLIERTRREQKAREGMPDPPSKLPPKAAQPVQPPASEHLP